MDYRPACLGDDDLPGSGEGGGVAVDGEPLARPGRDLEGEGAVAIKTCQLAGEHPLVGQYLLWQAPGGVAGTGPAFEALADGTIHLWTVTGPLTPHQTSSWSQKLSLGPTSIAELFQRLDAISYTQLPHQNDPGWECFPSFHYQPCAKCAAHELESYGTALNLLPEFQAVYDWIWSNIPQGASAIPPTYCVLMK